jgi:outer membrane lipoprotein-sorting protein
VKTSVVISLLSLLVLVSCVPKKQEFGGTEVPPGPMLQALEQRRQSFSGLKALASMQVVKRGSKRALDTVAIVLDAQKRLRMEGFGPLGQSLLALVWDGREVLLRMPGSDKVTKAGQAGLERLFGRGLEIQELCAILSGNIPELIQPYEAGLVCGRNDECVLDVRRGDQVRRVRISYSASDAGQGPRLIAEELYRSGKLLFEARFDRIAVVSHYRLPTKIVIENPDRKLLLTIEYNEAEVNVPIGEETFTLPDGEESGK